MDGKSTSEKIYGTATQRMRKKQNTVQRQYDSALPFPDGYESTMFGGEGGQTGAAALTRVEELLAGLATSVATLQEKEAACEAAQMAAQAAATAPAGGQGAAVKESGLALGTPFWLGAEDRVVGRELHYKSNSAEDVQRVQDVATELRGASWDR